MPLPARFDNVRFTNIAQIRDANNAAGYFWFSADTMRFFDSKVESRVFDAGVDGKYPKGSRVWIESTRNYDDTGRDYKVARFDVATGDIGWVYVDSTHTFESLAVATKVLEALL